MKIAGIDFPDPLLTALRNGELVVFAGAGVSMGCPACLPSFKELAYRIAEGTGEEPQDGEPDDRFLGRLQHKKVKVHNLAKKVLSGKNLAHTALHENLLRLYKEVTAVRIVTTNFDLLFEQASETVFNGEPEVFRAPALPLGRRFYGIVHVHGAVSNPGEMIITDADFGRAYLTEGWAPRFLIDLFSRFTVLFVGYSHQDTILNYLARALPVDQENQRFALIGMDDDSRRWELLGIEPVVYLKSNSDGHSVLHEGIRKLVEVFGRGFVDWQRAITEIAEKPPTIDEEETGLIEEALKDATKTRFFTDAASSPEWIEWLDKRNHLDALFDQSNLSEREKVLSQWCANEFMSRPDGLFLLICRHGNRLHPAFWFQLGRNIGLNEQDHPDNKNLARWISMLLSTVPATINEGVPVVLQWLSERCVQCGLMDSLLQVFDMMATSRVLLAPSLSWLGDTPDDQRQGIDARLPLVCDHHSLNELWENGLKPKLDQLAQPLLERLIRHLEARFFTFCDWQKASGEFDSTIWKRSAIEPHEQDDHPEAVDVLIDAARDCIDWLAQNQETSAAYWCDRLAASKAPLLRRLSVYAVTARDDLSADDKIDWLLTANRLHDRPAHREIFQLAKQAYPKASQECREVFIEAVLAYSWPNEEEPDKERLTARRHFDWLHWLHSAAPDCARTKQALDDARTAYPEWIPRDHPDLTYWTESDAEFVYPQSPWSTEELLAKAPADWLPEFCGPDRPRLMLAITDAAKQNFVWGADLAKALANNNEWDADLWDALIRVWSSRELDETEYREVLLRLEYAELYPNHGRSIAEILYSLVKDGGTLYAVNLLPRANEVASTLWSNLDPNEPVEQTGDWLTKAINHPAGVLVNFWLHGLSLWRKQQDPTPDGLGEEYLAALSMIAQDHALPGRLGRSVLASQFAYLLAVDDHWTRTNLLSFFSTSNDDDFRAVWDGFLTVGRLTPAVAEALDKAFLQAVERVQSGPGCNERRNRFIRYYADMIGYFAKDPISIWIPTLLKDSNEAIRKNFALEVMLRLRDLDATRQREWWQRWLERYWKNRLQNVPIALVRGEIEVMLEWLPHLTAVFSEAVDLAIRMPAVPLQYGRILHELKECNVAKSHPDAVARLLIHLRKADSPPQAWYKGRELINELLQFALPPDLKKGLEELLTKLH